uniref:Ras-GEF domain-containing protein n=1 Tax=Arcella intermedia TaxID=1963864 RepID=A0A6B2KZZ7_9EUKA
MRDVVVDKDAIDAIQKWKLNSSPLSVKHLSVSSPKKKKSAKKKGDDIIHSHKKRKVKRLQSDTNKLKKKEETEKKPRRASPHKDKITTTSSAPNIPIPFHSEELEISSPKSHSPKPKDSYDTKLDIKLLEAKNVDITINIRLSERADSGRLIQQRKDNFKQAKKKSSSNSLLASPTTKRNSRQNHNPLVAMDLPTPVLDTFPRRNSPDIHWSEDTYFTGEATIDALSKDFLIRSMFEAHQTKEWREVIMTIYPIFASFEELLEVFRTTAKRKVDNIPLTVAEMLKVWWKHNPWNFFIFGAKEEIFEQRSKLVEDLIESFEESVGKDLLSEWKGASSTFTRMLNAQFIGEAPKQLIPKNLPKDPSDYSVLDFNPVELARQMTLIDYKLLVRIPTSEFLNKNFMKEELCPNLTKFSERFNRVTAWICTEITMEANLKRRKKLLSHFIIIGIKLLSIRNYAGLMSVFIGLTQYPVSRMQLTWKSLPPPLIEKWEKLETICSPLNNFRHLRGLQNESIPPSIISPIIVIKDLSALEETIPIQLEFEGKDGSKYHLWNFGKLQSIGKLISIINACQKTMYQFHSSTLMQKFLENVPFEDMETCANFSSQNEPSSKAL